MYILLKKKEKINGKKHLIVQPNIEIKIILWTFDYDPKQSWALGFQNMFQDLIIIHSWYLISMTGKIVDNYILSK